MGEEGGGRREGGVQKVSDGCVVVVVCKPIFMTLYIQFTIYM